MLLHIWDVVEILIAIFFTNLLLSLPVKKKLFKSVNI